MDGTPIIKYCKELLEKMPGSLALSSFDLLKLRIIPINQFIYPFLSLSYSILMFLQCEKIFFLGSSWKRGMLSHALARAATRRLAISGVPFGCAGCEVKFRESLSRSKTYQWKISGNIISNIIFL